MPSSISTTASDIESLKDLFEYDKLRYQRKGYGLITATLLVIGFFFVLPMLAEPLYRSLPSHDSSVLFAVGSWVIHITIFTFSNLTMFCIYKLELPFFERYKISRDPWPWHKYPVEYRQQIKRTLITLFINQLVILPVISSIEFMMNTVTITSDPNLFPSTIQLISQITFFMIMEDTVFYWIHRLLHSRKLYGWIHKKHHEYKVTVGIASEYAHPVEFVLGNIIPASIGATLLGSKCHMFTWWMWLIVRVWETVDGHCGYDFSWSPFRLLPLSGSANYHDFHHSHNIGNFSSFFTYWDSICGTNTFYYRFLTRRQREEDETRDTLKEIQAKELKQQ